jgi:hypothetical protein
MQIPGTRSGTPTLEAPAGSHICQTPEVLQSGLISTLRNLTMP